LKHEIPFYKSIRTKAAVLFLVVFVTILVPANWLIFKKVKLTLEEADTRELSAEAEKLVDNLQLDPLSIPLPPNRYLLKVQAIKNQQIEELFSSPGFPVVAPHNYLEDWFVWDSLKIVNLKKGDEYSSSELVVSLARSVTQLRAQKGDVLSYLIVANCLSILSAAVLVFIAAGQLINPIKRIISTASKITASKTIDRVSVPSTMDESKQLAETLNEMFLRMELSIKNQVNFFASAAHELKTPLAVMNTELSVALKKVDLPTQKILQSQLHEVQRLDRLIQDFLLISQLKSETLTLRKEPERLEEVLYASLKKTKYLAEERNIQIQIKVEDNIPTLFSHIDFEKIQTVISNLLQNAFKYSLIESIVKVSISYQENRSTLVITNPVSTPIENLHLLKNEFHKSNELAGGLGMGLWIADQIITLHGGQLELSYLQNEFSAIVILKR
jgi:two-component system, OmpR family, heavy metal sensor histidine kinase CusS